MIKSHGNLNKKTGEFEYTCLHNEDMQFIFNNLTLELKDHNYANISPGFVSYTLVEKGVQHTINSLHFLIEGEAIMNYRGEKIIFSAGDVLMIGGNHVKCSWEYTQPSKEITLLFNMYLGNLDDIFASLSHPIILKKPDTVQNMKVLFENENYTSIFKMRNICLDCAEEFLSVSGTDLSSHIKIVKKYEKVFQYITENLSMNLHIDELCKAMHYSPSFFTKTFVKDNGITVKQYIHNKIMQEVEQLLIYSNMSLSDISEKFYFCELSYFTRWFIKNKGCTPSAYRQRLKKQNAGNIQ